MNTVRLKYCVEDLKSRLPGLFPYLEFDEYGNCNLVKATESIEGCYNQIMPSFTLPADVSLDNILLSGETYTYKTLYNYYYQYKDTLPNNSFIQWFMKGIGRYKVNIPDIDRKECDLVPEYGYYSECGSIYNDYYKMSLIINNYEKWKDETNEVNYELEKICKDYERMGGDDAKDYYKKLVYTANNIAIEYKKYANIEDSNYSLSINIISSYNDLGMVNTYMEYWDPEKIYENGDYVIYNDKTYICIDSSNCRTWDDVIEKYVFNEDGWEEQIINGNNVTIQGKTNSKLSGFKAGKNYISVDNIIETPSYNEDWLWYYNIGDISYVETSTDELGNIIIEDGCTRNLNINEIEKHLLAYGNVLTGITYENNKLTFTYVIGAHLQAELKEIITNEGKKFYHYDNFTRDEDDKYHGVEYTETYTVLKGGELDKLVEKDLFDDYVTTNKLLFNNISKKKFDIYKDCDLKDIKDEEYNEFKEKEDKYNDLMEIDDEYNISYIRFKCPFMLKLLSVNRGVNNINTNFNYLPSSFKVQINAARNEELHMPITKLEYFTGTTYQPQIQADVHVNRGNATAWERHIKLGEVKTFQAMLDYANGGFFNIK